MNKKTLVRNLIISLAFSALLGYAVYLFLQYDQFFSSLVRNIILICIGALFICIWWIFFVDLKAENRGRGMDDEEDDDDDESGYGNPDMMAEMDMNSSFNDEDEDDLSSIVFVPDSTAAPKTSHTEKTYSEPEFDQPADEISLSFTDEDFSLATNVAPQKVESAPRAVESPMSMDMSDDDLLDDFPTGISDPTQDGMELPPLDDGLEVSFELDDLDGPDDMDMDYEPRHADRSFNFVIPEMEEEPVEVAGEEPVETAIDLPQQPVQAEDIDFALPQQPTQEPEEPVEIAIELPIPETTPTEEEPVETAIDLSLRNEPAAQEGPKEIDLAVPETVETEAVPETSVVEETMAVETPAPVEETVVEPVEEAPVEEEPAEEIIPEEPVYVKPDVNTVSLHELTPEYIAMLDSSERKILATRIMREKRRRADLRAQQETIMKTQELQQYVTQQAAMRAQQLAAQQAIQRGPLASTVSPTDPAALDALRRRQESVRNHEAVIREAAARRAQEEAAQRQAMRAAQQAALLRDAERRAQEQAMRQEQDRLTRLERLRQETERSAMLEAERLAQQQQLDAHRPVVDSTVSAIQQVQQMMKSEREQRAAQERLARMTASQRTQEAANLHMLEMERRRQEAEAEKLRQQREQLAQLDMSNKAADPTAENVSDPEFGISLGMTEKLD